MHAFCKQIVALYLCISLIGAWSVYACDYEQNDEKHLSHDSLNARIHEFSGNGKYPEDGGLLDSFDNDLKDEDLSKYFEFDTNGFIDDVLKHDDDDNDHQKASSFGDKNDHEHHHHDHNHQHQQQHSDHDLKSSLPLHQLNNDKLRMDNAQNASLGEYPWFALILNANEPNGPILQYAGALIHKNWVLTAASAVGSVNSKSRINIVLGTNDLSDTKNRVVVKVQRILIPENYKSTETKNDIALLGFSQVKFTKNLSPINLPFRIPSCSFVNTRAHVAGFGGSFGIKAGHLAKGIVHIDPKCKCAEEINELCVNTFKAGYSRPCDGDYGGPIMWQERESAPWRVIGVLNDELGRCDNLDYLKVTAVQPHLDFIYYTILKVTPEL